MTPGGIIGIILAFGLSTALCAAIFGLAYWNRPLADPGAEIISVAVGGMVAALAAIVSHLFGGPR